MHPLCYTTACLLGGLLLAGCEPAPVDSAALVRTGFIQNGAIDEASGLQVGVRNPEAFFLHNDDGKPQVFVIDARGRDLGHFTVDGARNRDWEDLAMIRSGAGPLLVISDSGDNMAARPYIELYFVPEPTPAENGRYGGSVTAMHRVRLVYPDGARDCEALAFDPGSGDLLLLSKRDTPPRLYRIAVAEALAAEEAGLEFLGETIHFRAPTARDMMVFGQRDGLWVSQPTGLDISSDGSQAAVISYRSLYLFDRRPGESWLAAMRRRPVEYEGPPSRKEEALSYAADGQRILITTEGIPAPVYLFSPPAAPTDQSPGRAPPAGRGIHPRR